MTHPAVPGTADPTPTAWTAWRPSPPLVALAGIVTLPFLFAAAGMTLTSGRTECVAYPATCRKWWRLVPFFRKRAVPSSMNQRGLSRSAHIVGWPPMQ